MELSDGPHSRDDQPHDGGHLQENQRDHQVRAEAAARGEVPRPGLSDRPAAQRLAIVVGGFVVVIAVLLVVMKLAGTI